MFENLQHDCDSEFNDWYRKYLDDRGIDPLYTFSSLAYDSFIEGYQAALRNIKERAAQSGTQAATEAAAGRQPCNSDYAAALKDCIQPGGSC